MTSTVEILYCILMNQGNDHPCVSYLVFLFFIADRSHPQVMKTQTTIANVAIDFYARRSHFIVLPLIVILVIMLLRFSVKSIDECPIQPMISTYMIVYGIIHLLLIVLTCIGMLNTYYIYPRLQYTNEALPRFILLCVLVCRLILLVFGFAWLIVGSVWIFEAEHKGVQWSKPAHTTTYCRSELYRLAFALVVVNYIIYGYLVLSFLWKYISRKLKNKQNSQSDLSMTLID